jgi:predicted phosphoribosyltransferase
MFENRAAAGRALAEALARLDPPAPVVLAAPRGGVPVAAPVAERLGAPLEVLVVRKIGAPNAPELAAGALVEGPDGLVLNEPLLAELGLTARDLAPIIERERAELARRRARYGGAPRTPLAGRSAILVDDGIATGATVRAALIALGRERPARLVLAVPVAPPDVLDELAPLVDDVVCLARPSPFRAVGFHYRDFGEVGDEDVIAALARGRGR